MNEKEPTSEKKDPAADLSAMLGMGGFLDGVSSLITKFGELAERGETLRKATGETDSGKPYQSSMGFSVKFGPGGEGHSASGDSMRVTPMNASAASRSKSTSRTPQPTAGTATGRAESAQPKSREPQVEMFEEEDHLLLLAEMPGVASEAIQLEFQPGLLLIEGTSKTAHFKTTVELPRTYAPEQVAVTANNGVIEIRLNNL